MITTRYFQNGLINQVLSLETLFGLNHRYPGKLIVTNFDLYIPTIRPDTVFNNFFKASKYPNFMQDFFDFPSITFKHTKEDLLQEFSSDNMKDYFSPGKDDGKLDIFASGRKPIVHDQNYSFSHSNSFYYSSFFHNREPELDAVFAQIKPKQEYVELASLIATALGNFSGAHIRLTDHKHVVDLNNYPVLEALSALPTENIVIATDDPSFSQIPSSAIIIEEFIMSEFLKDFLMLPVVSGDALALLSNLVLHHSQDFIGTKTSTFTGYIQRYIYAKNSNYKFKFFNDEFGLISQERGLIDSQLQELPASKLYGII